MSAPTLDLSIVLSINERTKPILDGRVQPQGIRLMRKALFESLIFLREESAMQR